MVIGVVCSLWLALAEIWSVEDAMILRVDTKEGVDAPLTYQVPHRQFSNSCNTSPTPSVFVLGDPPVDDADGAMSLPGTLGSAT